MAVGIAGMVVGAVGRDLPFFYAAAAAGVTGMIGYVCAKGMQDKEEALIRQATRTQAPRAPRAPRTQAPKTQTESVLF